jgi:hypothetical protein
MITGTWEEFLASIRIISRIKTVYRELDPSILADLFAELERTESRVGRVYMNSKAFSAIRKQGRSWFDSETCAEKIKQGIMGMMWGAEIIVSKSFPDNTVIAVSADGILTDPVTQTLTGKGVILRLNVDIPEAKELMEIHERLQDVASDLQSLMSRASKVIQSMVTIVEKQSS